MQKKQNVLVALAAGIFLAKTGHAATAPTYVPGPTSGKISGAPGQVPEPSPVPFPSQEAPPSIVSTNQQGAYNPANDNPGLYSGLPTQMPEGLAQEPESFWKRSTMLGDLWGWRTKMENDGFEFDPVLTAEVFGNPSGGMKQGATYDQSLNLPLTVYLDRLVDGWDGGTVHANALWIAGNSLSADYVGDISGISNIAGYDTFRIQELWYQQTFWKARASLRAGLLAADAEFFTSDTASLFIDGTFGAFTFVGLNLPNPPVYPMAAPAVRFLVQPIPQFYFQSGVYNGNSNAQDVNKHGFNFQYNSQNGALVFSEIGWLLNQAAGDRGLVGTYKLGSFVHTANSANWNTGAGEGPDYGIYAIGDQELYKHGGKDISFFTRVGYAPEDINTINWYIDAGFNFSGFVPGRMLDTAGVAFARSNFSPDYSDAQVADGSNPFTQESVIEVTYKAQITPWWTLQPDFQYIFNPSGEEGSHNATVIGLRTTLVF
ncbi:MAG TPA: carbohydrate porin [Pseudomonadales bacterium]|nr:carbohydrate porin [Pseudomonadales bacterium]